MRNAMLCSVMLLAGCGAEEAVSEKGPVDESVVTFEAKADSLGRPTLKGDIDWGQTVEDRLTRREAYHAWRFEAQGGDRARLELAGLNGEDTYLLLFQRSRGGWRRVASNDDCHAGTLDACLETDLPADGEYRVVATTYSAIARGRPAPANYALSLVCAADDGRCGPVVLCGSRGLAPCPEGSYCDWPEDTCGADDRPGECRPVPSICPRHFDPVCGCDGETYGNSCNAAAAGVDVASAGECPRDGQGEGETCGGIAALQCADGLLCDYSGNVGCDIADVAGVCVTPTEVLCTREYAPVCGCDGRTYGNDCLRRAAYVALDHAGECGLVGGEGSTCGGIAGLQCGEGLVCNYADQDWSEAGICPADIAGTCIGPYAVRCANIDAPVCGCDGVTYPNDCMRIGAYAAKAHDGPCR